MIKLASDHYQASNALHAEIINQTSEDGFTADFGKAFWCIKGYWVQAGSSASG